MTSAPKQRQKHHKSARSAHEGRPRRLPQEYRALADFVDFGNLAEPNLVAQVRDADEAIAQARSALLDASLKGKLDDQIEATLRDKHEEHAQFKIAALGALFDKARVRFPHPQGWEAAWLPLPDRALEHGLPFNAPDTLLEAAAAVRDALRRIVEANADAGAEPREVLLPVTQATTPRIVLVGGKMLGPPDLYEDGLKLAAHGRDAWRLGICPICDSLFVRRRVDQPACGRTHSHAVFMREERRLKAKKGEQDAIPNSDRYKDQRPRYEATRKRNKQKKKERETLRRTGKLPAPVKSQR